MKKREKILQVLQVSLMIGVVGLLIYGFITIPSFRVPMGIVIFIVLFTVVITRGTQRRQRISGKLDELEDALKEDRRTLRSSLLELWEELEKDERYSQNPKIMHRLAELKKLCKD